MSYFLVKTVIFGWSLEFEIELFGHNPQIPQVCEFYDKYALFPSKKCPIFSPLAWFNGNINLNSSYTSTPFRPPAMAQDQWNT